jgi:hypothetical protein
MKKIQVAFLIIFLLQMIQTTQPAFASPESLSGAPPSVSDICTELMQQKQQIAQTTKISRLGLLFKLLFERGSLISPEEVAPAPQSSAIPTEAAEIENMTVFTLGHPEKVTAAEQSQLEAIRAGSLKEVKTLQKLLKTSTVAGCLAEARTLKWSPEELTGLQNQQTSALEAYRHQESEAAEKVAAKVKKQHPSWTIVPADSWGEITQNLRKSNPTGIMLIAHSSPSGRLFDSLRDEIPTPFFKALPESVKFVGVFSCDSEQVEKAYSLNDSTQGREFITVKLGSPFDKSESTPVQLFSTWASKVSKEKIDQTPKTQAAPAEPLCSVRIDSLKILKGRLSLSIANFPVGVWTVENEDQAQLFPCSWLNASTSDHSKLIAFIQPSALDNPVELGDTDFSVEIVTDMSHDALPVISSPGSSGTKEIFVNEDGHFRSAIFRF